MYRERSVHIQDTTVSEDEMVIDLRGDHPIYVGRFVDRDRPPFTPAKVVQA